MAIATDMYFARPSEIIFVAYVRCRYELNSLSREKEEKWSSHTWRPGLQEAKGNYKEDVSFMVETRGL